MKHRTRQFLAIAVVAVMVFSAGCAGWGTDGPADDEDTDPAETNETNETNETTETETDASAAEDPSDDADASDSNGDTDTSDDADDTDASDSDDTSDDSDETGAGAGDDTSDDTNASDSDGSNESDSSDDTDAGDDTSDDGDDTDDSDAGDGDTGDDSGDSGDSDQDGDDSDAGDGDDESDDMYEYSLTVEVVEDGEPVEGEPVRIAVHGEEFEEYETDENGEVTISFENSSPDEAIAHDVQVRNETRYVHVEQGEQRETFDVTETPNTATGIIRVVDENGDPVEGEPVTLSPPGTVDDEAKETRHTDENGEVVIELVAGEPTDVVLYGVEVRREEKRLGIMSDEHQGVQEVTFTVGTESEHSLTVNVEDAETGDAVDDEVTIRHIDTGQTFSAATEDGSVTFENLKRGTYAIDVDAGEEWYMPLDGSDEIEVDGETERTISMQPEPDMHTLHMKVTDAETGEPIEGTEVAGIGAVHPRGYDMMFSVETDSDGVAVAEAWESPYTLEVRAEGYELYMEDIVVDEDMTVEVALEPAGTEDGETNETSETNETEAGNMTASSLAGPING